VDKIAVVADRNKAKDEVNRVQVADNLAQGEGHVPAQAAQNRQQVQAVVRHPCCTGLAGEVDEYRD
jgi:hypothetical protein